EITARLKELPEVETVFVMGGTTPTGTLELRKASLILRLTPKNKRDRTQKEVEAHVAKIVSEVPDVRSWYVNERGERELSITLTGPDPAALDQAAASLENEMRRVPQFLNVAPST